MVCGCFDFPLGQVEVGTGLSGWEGGSQKTCRHQEGIRNAPTLRFERKEAGKS